MTAPKTHYRSPYTAHEDQALSCGMGFHWAHSQELAKVTCLRCLQRERSMYHTGTEHDAIAKQLGAGRDLS